MFPEMNILSHLMIPMQGESRSISAENPTGEKGKGGMATEGTGKKPAAAMGKNQGWKISPSLTYGPGETLTLAQITGPGIIQSIWFGGDVGRDFILRIYWDGEEQPSVECPLTEFFAYSWVKRHYDMFGGNFQPIQSLPVAVNPNRGLNCFWPMPFSASARITLQNRSDRDACSYFQINYRLCDVPEDAMYFHAQFRAKTLQRYENYTILDNVQGRGSYVGTALFVGLNGEGNWWGEGEVKFYIDGDQEFPTICGTGTEDYFGGSFDWEVEGKYRTYSTPFMGMPQVVFPENMYDVQKRFSLYRWHIMDPILFHKDIRITVQDLGWTDVGKAYLARRDDFASVAYWYQEKGENHYPPLPSADEIRIV